MTSRRRWLIVGVLVALLCASPYLVSKIPAAHSTLSAGDLLGRIRASADVPYSGYAEAVGGIALPTGADLGGLDDVLGGRTDLRIWFRTGGDSRVDAVTVTGETDLHTDNRGSWSWDYERNRATRVTSVRAPAARVPVAADLAPADLARRFLSEARVDEVSRIGESRIAGHDTVGLRLMPDQRQSTIARVDVWALTSGLAVKVVAYGANGATLVNTTMLDLSTERPAVADTRFSPPSNVEVEHDDLPDAVAAVNRFVQARPPDRLAGLPRTSSVDGGDAVGVYGRGVTVLVAIPLPERFAVELADRVSAVARSDGLASVLSVSAVSARLTAPDERTGNRWLLAGTVTPATLKAAEGQLPDFQDVFR